jgi:hypothetical protein
VCCEQHLQAPSATTRSVKDVLRSVIGQYGVAGLWRGATPSVMRLILLNSSMVATYDEVGLITSSPMQPPPCNQLKQHLWSTHLSSTHMLG